MSFIHSYINHANIAWGSMASGGSSLYDKPKKDK